MIKIAIVSGKGGVGKTSITAALAYELNLQSKKIMVIDTDVDAPNLALILKGTLISNLDVKTSKIAQINSQLCDGCGKCISHCKPEALVLKESSPIPNVISYLCEGCGICQIICPQTAISMKNKINGKIQVFNTDYGFKLVMGQLDIGGVASGKLVNETKEIAYSMIKEPLDLVLIDGPPGSGCPAIATISDVDYIIFVTEPTPTALHDLDKLVRIKDTFKIQAGAIINKFDIHKPTLIKIEKYLNQKNIKLYGEIPYNKIIPKSIVEGKPFNYLNPESDLTIIFKKIVKEINENLMR